MSARYRKIKRVLDWIVALLLAVVLLPVFLLIVVFYGLFFKGPVLFRQRRIGFDNTVFTMYKFRTLKSNGATIEERKFRFGSFLRFTSLDELPQLINILKGEMSFIGPRPLPEEYLVFFTENERRRHLVLPGITGLAQVSGRHSLSWEEKFAYDIYYVEHASVVLDFTILVRTIILIFSFRKDLSLEEKRFIR